MFWGHKLFWKIYLAFLVIVMLALLVSGWYTWKSHQEFFVSTVMKEFKAHARVLSKRFDNFDLSVGNGEFNEALKEVAHCASSRVMLMRFDGLVVGDSKGWEGQMDLFAGRNRIRNILQEKGPSEAFQHSYVNEKQLVSFVALPTDLTIKPMGLLFIRSAKPMQQALERALQRFAVVGLIVAMAALILSFHVARFLSEPIEKIRSSAERIANGDMGTRVDVEGSAEFESLCFSMNNMAKQLQVRIGALVDQRNESLAILESMVEGMIAVDLDGTILKINSAAADMFDLDSQRTYNKSLQGTIRQHSLHVLFRDVLRQGKSLQREIRTYDQNERFIRANGTLLQDSADRQIGVVIVLNDVTRIRELEDMRREFVANVSHELRTPLTSIRGFVETILDGAINNREDSEHFLKIILDQTNRLDSLIEDLLLLSKVENAGQHLHELEFDYYTLLSILQRISDFYEGEAAKRNISIKVDCPEQLKAYINASLLEQAIANLVENGVSYAGDGSVIALNAYQQNSEVVIEISDNGNGIPEVHLPHLFERFYRVEKSRSRDRGGTGLGLAIVKHVVQLHAGRIAVNSQISLGTTFTISLDPQKLHRRHRLQ